MEYEERLGLEIVISNEGINNRELHELRSDLFDEIEQGLTGEDAELDQKPVTRSVDPITIGTIGLVLLPVVVDKLIDILIKWSELHKSQSMTIRVPTKDGQSVELVYHPKSVKPEQLKAWLASAIELTQSGEA